MDWRGFGLVHFNVTLFFTADPLPLALSTDDDEIENGGRAAADTAEFPENHDVEESEPFENFQSAPDSLFDFDETYQDPAEHPAADEASSENPENSQDAQTEIPAESPQASSPSPSATTGQPQFFNIGSPEEQGDDTGSESATDDPLEIGENVQETETNAPCVE